MGKINFFSLVFLFLALLSLLFLVASPGNSNLASASATFAALATVFWAIRDNISRDEEGTSRFYLEKYEEVIKKSYGLISDGNNDRIKWILAARLVGIAESIEVNISQKHHLQILEMIKLEYRNNFSYALGVKNNKIYPAFFFGVHGNIPLIEAERRANYFEPIVRDYSGEKPYEEMNEVKELSERSVATICRFTVFPKEFEDKLGKEFTEQEIHMLGFLLPKVEEWVKFNRMLARQRQNAQ